MADINWSLFNTHFGEQLGAALDPTLAQERNNKLADLAQQRQLGNMQLADAVIARQDKSKAAARAQAALDEYTNGAAIKEVPQNVQDAIGTMQAMPQDAATQQTIDALNAQSVSRGRTPDENALALAKLGSLNPEAAKLPINMFDVQQKLAADKEAKSNALIEAHRAEVEKYNQAAIAREEGNKNRLAQIQAAQIAASATKSANSNIQKPLPTQALKMQQESLDAIGAASSMNKDLDSIKSQIDDGKLNFGPVSNFVNDMRNKAGSSTEESRNYATFKSNLEKLRNESLRLNKGVQTDGDAQRAWNELFNNINDTRVVNQRLGEIRRLNDRAVELRKLDIDTVRSNFGHAPLDTSGYQNVKAAIVAAHPQDSEAVQWARSNPSDKRSAAILKANGG
jgi:hypothetical protein